jgi:type VI secretion system protein ImpM
MNQPRPDGPSPSRAVGFVGKLPARADFVRQNIGEPIGVELDRWLVKSVENMQQAKAELPDGPLHFVFSAAGSDSVAIGAMTKSVDQVGRKFPLAIFTSLPVAQVARNFSAMPLAYAAFLSEASQLLAQASELALEEFCDRVLALVPPSAAVVQASVQQLRELLQATRAEELLTELFAGQPLDSRDYALFTFCAATEAASVGPPSGAATVLDCPIQATAALPAWLEFAQRRLDWSDRCPAFVWSQSPRRRLLLALGFASDQVLHFVAQPKHPSARLWPLTTERAEASARASATLSVAAPALSNRDLGLSVDQLWTLGSKVVV